VTVMTSNAPEWFDRNFPFGLCVLFGPNDETRFTLLEAAVFAFSGPGRFNWCDEAICEETGVTAAALKRVKKNLLKKYERFLKTLPPVRACWMPKLFRD
jgi:hypothetical protein